MVAASSFETPRCARLLRMRFAGFLILILRSAVRRVSKDEDQSLCASLIFSID
jgi:hypothetical protein